MVCSRCKIEAPEGKKFCGECGAALTPPETAGPVSVPGEDGAWFCVRHTKAVTRLRCGRCEAPITTNVPAAEPTGEGQSKTTPTGLTYSTLKAGSSTS